MDKDKYLIVEEYMLSCMNGNDSAHDCQHIYRVLYNALDISKDYEVDEEVLIISSLLHDIGRKAQSNNSNIDHAIEGADMAYLYLITNGWSEDKAEHVKSCILTHSNRFEKPSSIEAKILYDADKLDGIGAIGIARNIAYIGMKFEPLYSVGDNGQALPGHKHEKYSFFKEYNYGIKKIYDSFYTIKAKEISEKRSRTSLKFYNSLFEEVHNVHNNGLDLLNLFLDK